MKSLLLLFTLSLLLSGCGQTSDEMSGKELYEKYCAKCHKSTGKGNFLLGVPANKGTKLSYWEIKIKITKGSGKHSKMPKFPHLTDTQAGLIADYLLSMK
ncbi:c-type cytochrome [Litoribrevibacter euphylliae]|uniref:C-type cytochrome n=1 Tax=Litoribrevibacter euphylliae TaxID=1834034 RepID=A0ABV7HBG1_9GAMM